MSLQEKLLKIIFVILIIVLLGEIGYLVYNQFQLKNPSNNQINLTSQSLEKPNDIKIDPIYNKETIESILNLNKNIIKSSYLINEYEGEIIDLNITGGYSKSANFEYAFFIRIKNGENSNSFYFSKDELEKIKIYNNKNQELTFEDLKIDQKVKIEDKKDLLVDIKNNTISFNIYVKE